MFEMQREPLATTSTFFARLAVSISFGLLMVVLALFIGMAGYHYTETMPWIDAFLNASMILSGMGPVTNLVTFNGKLFAGFYALFSGLAFIAIIGVIIAPIFHRFFHRFHLEVQGRDK